LKSVQVRPEDGGTAEAVDIRRPVAVDMVYKVLQPGHVLSPWFEFFNEEGLEVFSAVDLDPEWRRKPRPSGTYRSTALIPGNLLSEGTLFVRVGMATMNPAPVNLLYEREVVAFHVCDSMDGDSARGDWSGEWGGAVRPLLKWETEFTPAPLVESMEEKRL
jgi:lipopolysaccharide transport system ATP-binding protein